MEQGEDAKLGILDLGDQIRLSHDDFGTKPHPLVAALLRAGNGACVATQKRQRPRYRLGHFVGGWTVCHDTLPRLSRVPRHDRPTAGPLPPGLAIAIYRITIIQNNHRPAGQSVKMSPHGRCHQPWTPPNAPARLLRRLPRRQRRRRPLRQSDYRRPPRPPPPHPPRSHPPPGPHHPPPLPPPPPS